jgi:hypothetical protein
MVRRYPILLVMVGALGVLGLAGAGLYVNHKYPALLPLWIAISLGLAFGALRALFQVSRPASSLQKTLAAFIRNILRISNYWFARSRTAFLR